MTAQEKWGRLTNPKTADDYGISMTESELLKFDDGKKLVESLRGVADERMDLVAKMIAGDASETIERVSYGTLKVYPLQPETPEHKQDKSCGQRGLEPD